METRRSSQQFLRIILRRMGYALASFIGITLFIYGAVMLVPPEGRAELFLPRGKGAPTENYRQAIIKQHHLDDPYLVQYGYWLKSLLDGTWGYSPTLQEDVLQALLRRTPATLELGLFSLLLLIPLGLWSGLLAGWRPGRFFDTVFRSLASVGLSIPPFILALVLLSIFYAGLGWLGPGRLDMMLDLELAKESFRSYTGMLTIDGVLNGRPDVSLNALKHLVLPVITLSLYHWATLGRIARSLITGERRKEYLLAARGRGISERRLIWRHALRSILAPSLTGIALSAASIVSGVYVVEIIFMLNGISDVVVVAMTSRPDAPAVLGFAVYSVVLILALMLLLDLVQILVDPRVRAETLN